MFETTKTVREYALEIPEATRIFEKLGIDYCCGGLEICCNFSRKGLASIIAGGTNHTYC